VLEVPVAGPAPSDLDALSCRFYPCPIVQRSRWVSAALCLVAVVVLWTDLRRFQDPVGEKYITLMPPGGADFVPPFLGACALVSGANPYRNDVAAWRDPWMRELAANGLRSPQIYLPTHLLVYTPLVLAAGGDPLQGGNPRIASRYWFNLNLWLLVLLALVTWGVVARAHGDFGSPGWSSLPLLLFLLFVLALNTGTKLGLERGQSETLTALLCWSAVLLALHDRPGAAVFLATAAALLKGYGAPFAGGLALILLDRRRARGVVLGGVAALGLLLLPVAGYLPDALHAVYLRAQGLDPTWAFAGRWTWVNHSFRNLAFSLTPSGASAGEALLRTVAIAATVLSWLAARRSVRHDRTTPEAALWLSLFTVCSLGAMITYPPVSFCYNTIQVLPGVLVLVLGQDRFLAGLRPWIELGARAILLATCGLLFLYTLDSSMQLPLDALGLALLLGLAAVASAARLWRPWVALAPAEQGPHP
jgi:hypothetical protein